MTLEDCLLRRGMDFDLVAPTPLPLVPGHDVVGRIVAVGLDVTDFKEGDRVAALIRTGGNARYASVPASSLVRVPMSLDAAEASCMVTVYSHAYRCLKAVSSDGPMFSLKGKKILIIGGMDGVGQALTQMCNKARADIWATAPKRRHAYVRGILGATPLPEHSSEWLHDYKETFDIVFDGVCNDALDAAKKAVKPGGKVVCFGYSSLLREDMGVLGAPMSGYFSRLVSQTTASNIDVWEFAQRDPETYKVRPNA